MRRRGLVGHRGLFSREVITFAGLPVTSPAETWVDMGELIAPGFPLGIDDLVVMGDAVANRLGSVEPLREALAARVGPRGKLDPARSPRLHPSGLGVTRRDPHEARPRAGWAS